MSGSNDTERASLLAALARATARDPLAIVTSAIVEPTTAHFPDAWERTERGLWRVTQRLLGYAGLGDRIAVVALDDEAVDRDRMLPGTAVALAGIEGPCVHFSCTQLGDVDDVVLAMAHEVARAVALARRSEGAGPYREDASRGFVEPADTDDERREASVLAVALGLGLLGTIGSHRYRAVGRGTGYSQITEWRHTRYGGVEPHEASYLLAIQLVLRALPPSRLADLLAQLPTDRRSEVEAEMQSLDRASLLATLSLPSPETWPSEAVVAVATLPKRATDRAKKKRPIVPVFRMYRGRSTLGGFIGVGAGSVLACLAKTILFPVADATLAMLGVLWAGAIAGAWIGQRNGIDLCSACTARVPGNAERCTGCGGKIVGRIRVRSDHADAAEAWKRERRQRREEARADTST